MKKIIITEAQLKKAISAISKDKDKEIFDYHSITSDAWHELLQDAQKIQKINFATENDDSTGEKKTFYVKKNLRKDQPIKYEFNAELMEAGGDWECPVMYFRIEFTHDYFYGKLFKGKENPEYAWEVDRKSPKLYKAYVVIPPVEAGNKLTKEYKESSEGNKDTDKWFAYQNNELSKEQEKEVRITDADKRKAWKWLEELLSKLVEDNHEMLDENTEATPTIDSGYADSHLHRFNRAIYLSYYKDNLAFRPCSKEKFHELLQDKTTKITKKEFDKSWRYRTADEKEIWMDARNRVLGEIFREDGSLTDEQPVESYWINTEFIK